MGLLGMALVSLLGGDLPRVFGHIGPGGVLYEEGPCLLTQLPPACHQRLKVVPVVLLALCGWGAWCRGGGNLQLPAQQL